MLSHGFDDGASMSGAHSNAICLLESLSEYRLLRKHSMKIENDDVLETVG